MANGNQEIINELKNIRIEIEFIKQHMVDTDSIMTEDDYVALKEYEKEKEEGELISHEDLKKELQI